MHRLDEPKNLGGVLAGSSMAEGVELDFSGLATEGVLETSSAFGFGSEPETCLHPLAMATSWGGLS